MPFWCYLLTFPSSILKISSTIHFQCQETQWPLTTWALFATQAPGGRNTRMLLFSIWVCYQNAIGDVLRLVSCLALLSPAQIQAFLFSSSPALLHCLCTTATCRGKRENREEKMRQTCCVSKVTSGDTVVCNNQITWLPIGNSVWLSSWVWQRRASLVEKTFEINWWTILSISTGLFAEVPNLAHLGSNLRSG